MSLCKHVNSSLSSLLTVSQALDHLDWRIEETCSGVIDQSFIADVSLEKETYAIFFKFLPEGVPRQPGDEEYLWNKIFALNNKIIALTPVELTVDHLSLCQKMHKGVNPSEKYDSLSPRNGPEITQTVQEIFSFSKQLDQIEWGFDEQLKDHPISANFISETKLKTLQCYQQYLKEVLPKITLGIGHGLCDSNLHFLRKHERLTSRLITLAPIEPQVIHRQFVDRAQIKVQYSSAAIASILDLTEIIPTADEPLSPLLTRISAVFCHGNDRQVQQALNRLPVSSQKNLIDALWIVRGRQTLTDCIGHKNFGELLFTSSPQQKACAIEFVKFSSVITDLLSVVKKNNLSELRERFKLSAVHIQNEIFKKHWEQMGRPTSKSPEDLLRKIAHDDFGRVSFLGLEKRCDVLASHKVKTLEAYQTDFDQKIKTAQIFTEQIKANWDKCDFSEEVFGEKKNSIKKENLHDFVKKIVPLFEGQTHLLMDSPEKSYHVLARAYIEKYSCLKPFFLQLMNNL